MQSNLSKSISLQAGSNKSLFEWVSKIASPLFPDRTQQLLKRAREDQQIARWVAQSSTHQPADPFVPPMSQMMAQEEQAPIETKEHSAYEPEAEAEEENFSSDIPRSLAHLTQVGAHKNYQQYNRNPIPIDYNVLYSARHEASLIRQEDATNRFLKKFKVSIKHHTLQGRGSI